MFKYTINNKYTQYPYKLLNYKHVFIFDSIIPKKG